MDIVKEIQKHYLKVCISIKDTSLLTFCFQIGSSISLTQALSLQ